MLFFLSALEILIVHFEKKYDLFKETGRYSNERQKKIVEFVKKVQPVKISDIQKNFEAYPLNTIKKDMQYLIENSLLDKIGKFKATAYITKQNK
jgi:DeoR/GlpR family transcriptional regulator of sugar metabolism